MASSLYYLAAALKIFVSPESANIILIIRTNWLYVSKLNNLILAQINLENLGHSPARIMMETQDRTA